MTERTKSWNLIAYISFFTIFFIKSIENAIQSLMNLSGLICLRLFSNMKHPLCVTVWAVSFSIKQYLLNVFVLHLYHDKTPTCTTYIIIYVGSSFLLKIWLNVISGKDTKASIVFKFFQKKICKEGVDQKLFFYSNLLRNK